MWYRDFRKETINRSDVDSFSICVIAREEVSDMLRFVEHHLYAGAEHIYLYFDGSSHEAKAYLDAFKDIQAVTVFVCDTSFWRDVYPNETIPALVRKQIAVRKLCIGLNKSDWLYCCDADEFLSSDEHPGAVLARLSPECLGVSLRNTEAVWGGDDDLAQPFGCGFERAGFPNNKVIRKVLSYLVYGRNAYPMRRGVTGHIGGKYLVRKGVMPNEVKCHFAVINGARTPWLDDLLPSDHANLRIVHFDAIGHKRWSAKWKTRINGYTNSQDLGKVRIFQMKKIEAAMADGTDEKLFRHYYGLNLWQQFILQRLGLLTRIDK